jgi:hypothetical protein
VQGYDKKFKMENVKVGDFVIFIPNGLKFRVENSKMLKWMIISGNYKADL